MVFASDFHGLDGRPRADAAFRADRFYAAFTLPSLGTVAKYSNIRCKGIIPLSASLRNELWRTRVGFRFCPRIRVERLPRMIDEILTRMPIHVCNVDAA